ncbi:hypothetical protein [Microvirga tunisiensis]|uniref:Uncharacterized protein n=1 Tax=Microvirga tunisiensis TaxID=2108360 RepID=A0A5N7MTV4_9HYPH|nr:hypothetical protein [Microvirga tunisiensis]MPR11941.1 hypothetical protein [Microvirga tunisiensis]MPR29899.1 hypothetical protein [Microvirga tunisiensis]
MAKPIVERDFFNDCYVILPKGKKSRPWAPANWTDGRYRTFRTRAAADNFIRKGGLIEVTEIPVDAAIKASGWDEELGHCEANYAVFRDWLEREGVHFYAREKEDFFPAEAIREAQERGLSKVVMENMS